MQQVAQRSLASILVPAIRRLQRLNRRADFWFDVEPADQYAWLRHLCLVYLLPALFVWLLNGTIRRWLVAHTAGLASVFRMTRGAARADADDAEDETFESALDSPPEQGDASIRRARRQKKAAARASLPRTHKSRREGWQLPEVPNVSSTSLDTAARRDAILARSEVNDRMSSLPRGFTSDATAARQARRSAPGKTSLRLRSASLSSDSSDATSTSSKSTSRSTASSSPTSRSKFAEQGSDACSKQTVSNQSKSLQRPAFVEVPASSKLKVNNSASFVRLPSRSPAEGSDSTKMVASSRKLASVRSFNNRMLPKSRITASMQASVGTPPSTRLSSCGSSAVSQDSRTETLSDEPQRGRSATERLSAQSRRRALSASVDEVRSKSPAARRIRPIDDRPIDDAHVAFWASRPAPPPTVQTKQPTCVQDCPRNRNVPAPSQDVAAVAAPKDQVSGPRKPRVTARPRLVQLRSAQDKSDVTKREQVGKEDVCRAVRPPNPSESQLVPLATERAPAWCKDDSFAAGWKKPVRGNLLYHWREVKRAAALSDEDRWSVQQSYPPAPPAAPHQGNQPAPPVDRTSVPSTGSWYMLNLGNPNKPLPERPKLQPGNSAPSKVYPSVLATRSVATTPRKLCNASICRPGTYRLVKPTPNRTHHANASQLRGTGSSQGSVTHHANASQLRGTGSSQGSVESPKLDRARQIVNETPKSCKPSQVATETLGSARPSQIATDIPKSPRASEVAMETTKIARASQNTMVLPKRSIARQAVESIPIRPTSYSSDSVKETFGERFCGAEGVCHARNGGTTLPKLMIAVTKPTTRPSLLVSQGNLDYVAAKRLMTPRIPKIIQRSKQVIPPKAQVFRRCPSPSFSKQETTHASQPLFTKLENPNRQSILRRPEFSKIAKKDTSKGRGIVLKRPEIPWVDKQNTNMANDSIFKRPESPKIKKQDTITERGIAFPMPESPKFEKQNANNESDSIFKRPESPKIKKQDTITERGIVFTMPDSPKLVKKDTNKKKDSVLKRPGSPKISKQDKIEERGIILKSQESPRFEKQGTNKDVDSVLKRPESSKIRKQDKIKESDIIVKSPQSPRFDKQDTNTENDSVSQRPESPMKSKEDSEDYRDTRSIEPPKPRVVAMESVLSVGKKCRVTVSKRKLYMKLPSQPRKLLFSAGPTEWKCGPGKWKPRVTRPFSVKEVVLERHVVMHDEYPCDQEGAEEVAESRPMGSETMGDGVDARDDSGVNTRANKRPAGRMLDVDGDLPIDAGRTSGQGGKVARRQP